MPSPIKVTPVEFMTDESVRVNAQSEWSKRDGVRITLCTGVASIEHSLTEEQALEFASSILQAARETRDQLDRTRKEDELAEKGKEVERLRSELQDLETERAEAEAAARADAERVD
jgi:multidrug efflux pump subunit AcrA (membrane-fusion protein)